MNLLDRARSVLEEEGYHVRSHPNVSDQIAFEDSSLFGLLCVFDNAEEILDHWHARQERFLRANTNSLVQHPSKAWNAYAVFLTSDQSHPELRAHLLRIEEDFAGARKIARANVTTREGTERALMPLLSLKRTAVLEPVDLRARIDAEPGIHPTIKRGLLNGDPAEAIAARLLEAP